MTEATPSCKIPHGTDGYIPEWLCRQCHPELNLSTEERRALEATDRKQAAQTAKRAAKQREIGSLERTIFELGNPRVGSVSYKIKMSHEKKLAKLRRKVA